MPNYGMAKLTENIMVYDQRQGMDELPIITQAFQGLKAKGYDVEPCPDIPGLFVVNGRELTQNQTIQFAARAGVRFV